MIPEIILSFLLGLFIGSFLNVVICRLPRGERIDGRSRCPRCKKTLAWFELIPIFSFLVLTRKCRTCKSEISWQYPLVELATASLFALSAYIRLDADTPTHGAFIIILRDWFVISALVVTFVTDMTTQLIYDAVLLVSGIAVFILGLATGEPLWRILLGGILGASFFGLQYVISRGAWIGAGDIILGGFLGISLGFPRVLAMLALAYTAGLVIALPLVVLNKKKWSSRIAFGTFLSMAGIVTLFWGNALIDWYINLILA